MATNPKIKRQWIKEEKRIVSLLYRKGLLKDFKITDFYWAEYHWFRSRKYKSKRTKYSFPIYLPEVHYCTTDYWGESDEHSIVSTILDHLYWSNIDEENFDPTSGEWLKSTFNKRMTRKQFIKYLEKLPTKVSDRKLDKMIRKQNKEEY